MCGFGESGLRFLGGIGDRGKGKGGEVGGEGDVDGI